MKRASAPGAFRPASNPGQPMPAPHSATVLAVLPHLRSFVRRVEIGSTFKSSSCFRPYAVEHVARRSVRPEPWRRTPLAGRRERSGLVVDDRRPPRTCRTVIISVMIFSLVAGADAPLSLHKTRARHQPDIDWPAPAAECSRWSPWCCSLDR